MRVRVVGHGLPGRAFGPARNVHVALQVRADPESPVPGDAAEAQWETEVRLVGGDCRGPAVHGRRGERFLYLTWGEVDDEGGFTMFRRAKLVLDRADPALLATADADDRVLVARVALTDERGGPRCARVDPPAVEWRVE